MQQAQEEIDLYEVLGVQRSASQAEIKKAYHKAALSTHPDKVPQADRAQAEIKFKAIGQAYDILQNDDTRQLYDMHGMAAFEKGGGMEPGPADMQEFFASMFGDMPGMNGGPRRRPGRGPDEITEYQITLEDLYKGKTAHFSSNKKILCRQCKGRGGKDGTRPKTCEVCGGKGKVTRPHMLTAGMFVRATEWCGTCRGEGKFFRDKDRCKKCKGQCVVQEKKQLELYIPPGSQHGEKLTIAGEGDQAPDQEPGDIVFVLAQKVHDVFKRSGDDLAATIRITLAEALCGFHRVVLKHLDGRGIQLHHNPAERVLRPNQTLCVPDEGMPVKRREQKGNLFLKVFIQFPDADALLDSGVHDKLKGILPKPEPPIHAAEVDEVNFQANANMRNFGGESTRPRATDAEEEYEEMHGPRTQCRQQ
ncbi:MAG: hypothetical protein Q9162_006092 [Coniocarpon cinnabarinum]